MAESWLTSEAYSYDNLIPGDFPVTTRAITLLSGENRSRGALLGKITKALDSVDYDEGNTGDGTLSSVAMGLLAKLGNYILTCISAPDVSYSGPATGTADGGNTGNGTMTAASAGSGSIAGTWIIECIEAASDAGRFKVVDPNGERWDDATVGVAYSNTGLALTLNDGSTDFVVGDKFTYVVTAAGDSGIFSVEDPDGLMLPNATVASAYSHDQIEFTIGDGSADWVVGDIINIPVIAGSGKYKLSTSTAVDGSQELKNCVILAQDTNASAADVETVAFDSGEFNQNELTLGSSHTVSTIKEELRQNGIHLVDSLEAA